MRAAPRDAPGPGTGPAAEQGVRQPSRTEHPPRRRGLGPSAREEPWPGIGRYRVLSLFVVGAVLLLVGTGGWVRLSESGLGCPTWPKCYGSGLIAHANYHALTEFVNRCLITVTAVLIGMAILGAVPSRRRRPDLLWLSVGLLAGYIVEAVLGGLTVLARLAPLLVAAHLVVAMLLLADATILQWQATRSADPAVPVASANVRLLASTLLAGLGAVIVLGTVATGSGPDAGSTHVVRFGFPFRATVELHAVVGMFVAGMVVATFLLLRSEDVSPRVMRAYELLLLALVGQGVIGYLQYFTGLPLGVVESHIVGAGVVVITAVRFRLTVGRPRQVALSRAQAA